MSFNNEPQTGSSYSYRFEAPEPFYVNPAPPEPPKKKRGAARMVALCLVCALLGGAAGGFAVSRLDTPEVFPSAPIVTPGASGTSSGGSLADDLGTTESAVYEMNVNSCVHISISSLGSVFGRPISTVVMGSGFVVTADGFIVTNYHVVSEVTGDSVIKVGFRNGSTYTATVVATEQASDLALLKIDVTGLTPVKFGDSSELKIGYRPMSSATRPASTPFP